MSYAERAYFDGDHCQHVARRDEANRIKNIERQNRAALRGLSRRSNRDR